MVEATEYRIDARGVADQDLESNEWNQTTEKSARWIRWMLGAAESWAMRRSVGTVN
jgi:hypothetical protein